MSDIVGRLRSWAHAVDAVPANDLMDEAADEIERLRAVTGPMHGATMGSGFATLADSEREAIALAERDYADNDMDAGCYRIAATLRGLLERLK